MASTTLKRTFTTDHGNVYKWTYSFWVKRCSLGSNQCMIGVRHSGDYTAQIKFTTNDQLEVHDYRTSYKLQKVTNRRFRDTTSWYHIVVSNDNSVSSPDTKIYVNGVEETSFATDNEYSQNDKNSFNDDYPNYIGEKGTGDQFDGYISHLHFIDGTAYAASTFGSTDATTGEWKINTDPSVTYGTNGFLILKDGNTITDQSPNSNDFTLDSGTLTKSEDNPSNVFATLNSLDRNTNVVLQNGNNTSYSSANNTWSSAIKGTLGIASGKFYWEMKITGSGTANGLFFGVCADTVTLITNQGIQDNATEKAKGVLVFCDDGQYQLDTNSRTSMTSAPAFNDILGCAVDRDNNTVKFYKNGSEVGSIDISSSPLATCSNIMPLMINYYTDTKFNFNFGNGCFGSTQLTGTTYQADGNLGIFKYQPPSGFTALCTKGLNL